MNLYDLRRTHFSSKTVDTLQKVSKLLPKDAIFVNIGAYMESSTACILYGRPDIVAYSIDIEMCQNGLDNLEKLGLSAVRLLGTSQDHGKKWDSEIDMVYIDGDHSYESVKEDIELWVPWVKKNGFIAFHDYGTPHTPGVVKAVDEFVEEYGYPLFLRDGWDKEDVLRIYRVG